MAAAVNSGLQVVLKSFQEHTHPGLYLDKLHECWPEDRKAQTAFPKTELKKVTQCRGDEALLQRVTGRRRGWLNALGALRWTSKTADRMTLQLARAGSFENAGIGLHPLYGFVCIPGTSLKGMALAYARDVLRVEKGELEGVFGRGAARDEDSCAGAVVFHEAWPVRWPKLVLDIVNNHHGKYYGGSGDSAPPDDFEDPVPVTFLGVARGTEFEFAVSPRRGSCESESALENAKKWLEGALRVLGAGAKTAAGYGRFTGPRADGEAGDRAIFTARLRLVTPAFLAGAEQGKEDCELRPATLRGLLRWWWRTLHAGYLSVGQLRTLEAQIWGSTVEGSPLGIEVEGKRIPMAEPYQRENLVHDFRLERSSVPKTTQGLYYLSFGMERGKRHYTPAGAEWEIRMTARSTKEHTADEVLNQGIVALWMLAEYGGIGAKCRRSFGSVSLSAANPGTPGDIAEARKRAADVRKGISFREAELRSSSMERMTTTNIALPGMTAWYAIDQLGYAYQAYSRRNSHRGRKAALGLPRRIDTRERVTPPLNSRLASPLHFRILQEEGGFSVRVTVLVPVWRGEEWCQTLKDCVAFIKEELKRRCERAAPPAPAGGVQRHLPTAPAVEPATAPPALKVGERTFGVLCERNVKGTWKVKEERTGWKGPVQNSRQIPGEPKTGDRISLKVKINKPGDPAFDWVTE